MQLLDGPQCRTGPAHRRSMRGAAVLLLGCCPRGLGAPGQDLYTTNAICLRRHCVNPIFPGLEDLRRLSESSWFCADVGQARQAMGFCRSAVNYDLALPAGTGDVDIAAVVKKQDGQASTAFMYHLSGLGLEAWDYTKPALSGDDCIKSMWRLVCYTYFPRAPAGCRDGEQTEYMRPCRSSCSNYVRSCGVECCDESVQCVFNHTRSLSANEVVMTSGYLPHDGPSSLCTGGARRPGPALTLLHGLLLLLAVRTCDAALGQLLRPAALAPLPGILWPGVLAAVPLLLQGCDVDVPSHTVGNWRAEKDYLIKFQYVPPGGSPRDASLNSCGLENLSPALQCSGRGVCKIWDKEAEDLGSPDAVTFCECERDWADPECTTRRKSQTVAFLLSLFFGYLGVDHFYMGFWTSGIFKLLTLGGAGFWWIIDFIRVGSAPVPSKSYRLAADLSHYVFVFVAVTTAMTLGFVLAYITVMRARAEQLKDAILRAGEEEAYAAKAERKHLPGRPQKPTLHVGAPGMQLFRPSPAKSYGAVEERTPMAVHAQRETMESCRGGPAEHLAEASATAPLAGAPMGCSFYVPRGSYGPPRSVRDAGTLFRAVGQGHVLDSGLAPQAPLMGPLEPVGAGFPTAQTPVFTPSSVSGFTPASGFGHASMTRQ